MHDKYNSSHGYYCCFCGVPRGQMQGHFENWQSFFLFLISESLFNISLIVSSKIIVIKATSTALWKILVLVFYCLGILMLGTNCYGMGAKEDPELVISFQLTFILLEI